MCAKTVDYFICIWMISQNVNRAPQIYIISIPIERPLIKESKSSCSLKRNTWEWNFQHFFHFFCRSRSGFALIKITNEISILCGWFSFGKRHLVLNSLFKIRKQFLSFWICLIFMVDLIIRLIWIWQSIFQPKDLPSIIVLHSPVLQCNYEIS